MCQSTKGRDDTRCVAALCYLWRKDTWLNSLVGEGQEIDGVWQEPEMRLFVELNRLGTTVLIASHDLALVRSLDAPVLELADGKLIDDGARAA